ncbi:glycosyltransferase [Geodermatophilus sp. SYSU D00684]
MPDRSLRICQVVPYVSEDGAFGGPISVAVEQCRSLAAAGHRVTLLAGWDGRASLRVPGVDVVPHRARRVAPSRRFSALLAPGVSRDLRARTDVDVIHFHLPRDLTTVAALHSARRHRALRVVQTHGMVPPARSAPLRLFDRTWLEPALRSADCQVVLGDHETTLTGAAVTTRPIPVRTVPNGVPERTERAAWSATPHVVYCSRLHPRKRPGVFVEAAARVLASGHTATFSLIGADEGCLPAVRNAISALGLEDHVRYEGPVPREAVIARLAAAQCFVLPSVEEPFPMALLEALSVGLPSVITDSTGISEDLRARGGALVTDGTVAEVATAIATVVTASRAEWDRLSRSALAAAGRYSSTSMADRLLEVYQEGRSAHRHEEEP